MTAPASPTENPQSVPYEALVAAAGLYSYAQIIQAYVAQAAALRRLVFGALVGSWPGRFTDRDVDRFLDAFLPALAGAQDAMDAVTRAYLRQLDDAINQPDPRQRRTPASPVSSEGRRRPESSTRSRPDVDADSVGRGRLLPLARGSGERESQRAAGAPPRGQPSPSRRAGATAASRRDHPTQRLRGVDPRVVYRRPVTTLFVQRARGKSPGEAENAALRRATNAAANDLQLAATHAARDVLADDERVVGYRRVLTGAESCGLCIVASSQRYHRGDLMPIHPNCDCVVAPIYGTRDPGRYINSAQLTGRPAPASINDQGVDVYGAGDLLDLGDLLEAAHNAVLAEFGAAYDDARGIDYRKVLMSIAHGELGPQLRVARTKFTRAQRDSGDLSAPADSYGKTRRDFGRRYYE